VAWHEPVVEADDVAAHTDGFWDGYVHNCMSVNMVCAR
jgi:hypothetical protein